MTEFNLKTVRSVHTPVRCDDMHCPVMHWCAGCTPNGDQPCTDNPWPCPPLLKVDPYTCLGVVADCPDCVAEAAASRRGGGHQCDFLCGFFGEQKVRDAEFHAGFHKPERCHGCGGVLNDRRGGGRLESRACPDGCCTVWFCPDCGQESMSDGPVGCPSSSPVEDGADV